LLESLQQPVKITAFVSSANELKPTLDTLFKRYQEQQPLIEYESINPDLAPDKVREFNIQRDGEVRIEIAGRSENLGQISEQNVTNVIARLSRQGERWIVFLQGHGERDPYGDANFDLQVFASNLSNKGFHIESVDLTATTAIPDNTDVLVIADAHSTLLPGELALIETYVADGGNLIWLTEPGQTSVLESLADQLYIHFLPGVIVDPSTQLLGLNRVDYALAADYPRHPITSAIDTITLYPKSQGLIFFGEQTDWQQQPLVLTHDRTWNETGDLQQAQITQGDNDDEQAGPLTLAYGLTRSLQNEDGSLHSQRIIVTGDSDFLSNQFIGNGSNLDLGLNMLNWLSFDDNLISISPRSAIDTRLDLSPNQQMIIAVAFLILLPMVLLGSGLRIWLVRRKR
jgi:ABC-type uncharacterized transport system involved in gliding motility auxiliary subunit